MAENSMEKDLRYLYSTCFRDLFFETRATRMLSLLSPLVSGWSYLPMTNWSAGPEYYAHICNDLIINKKESVIEAGSGISTILMARLIKKNNLKTKIISIDHDPIWQNVIAHCLETDGIAENVQFICSPLAQQGEYSWYDKSKIVLPENFVTDTIVIDGPIGNAPMARYEAIPFLKKYLSSECYTIYLHDTDRPDEQETIRRWLEILPNSAVQTMWRYSVIQFGTAFWFAPQTVA